MNTWSPLWSGVVDSSLWEEEADVVKVFLTLLATKNSDHVSELDPHTIAKKCHYRLPDGRYDEVRVLGLLTVLASPDTKRVVPQEFEGRRIQAVAGGWLVLNGEKYREMVQKEQEKARWRRAQNRARAKAKGLPARGTPLAGENAAVKAMEGGNAALADAIYESTQPKRDGDALPDEL